MIEKNPIHQNYIMAFEGFNEQELITIKGFVTNWFNGNVKSIFHKPNNFDLIKNPTELLDKFSIIHNFNYHVIEPELKKKHDIVLINDTFYSLIYNIAFDLSLSSKEYNPMEKQLMQTLKIYNNVEIDILFIKVRNGLSELDNLKVHRIKKHFKNSFFLPVLPNGEINENIFYNHFYLNYNRVKIDNSYIVKDYDLLK